MRSKFLKFQNLNLRCLAISAPFFSHRRWKPCNKTWIVFWTDLRISITLLIVEGSHILPITNGIASALLLKKNYEYVYSLVKLTTENSVWQYVILQRLKMRWNALKPFCSFFSSRFIPLIGTHSCGAAKYPRARLPHPQHEGPGPRMRSPVHEVPVLLQPEVVDVADAIVMHQGVGVLHVEGLVAWVRSEIKIEEICKLIHLRRLILRCKST